MVLACKAPSGHGDKTGSDSKQLASVESKVVFDAASLSCSQAAQILRLDEANITQLMHAVLCQDYDLVRSYLGSGVDPNAAVDGKDSLFVAVRLGSTDIMKELIAAGANLDGGAMVEDSPLLSAFHYFIATSDWAPFDLLIEAGANPAARNGVPPYTIVEELAYFGHYAKVDELLSKGYDQEEIDGLLEVLMENPNSEDERYEHLLERVRSLCKSAVCIERFSLD